MNWILKAPLHWQILVALVLGTGIGLVLNPGDVQLPDAQFQLEGDLRGYTILETREGEHLGTPLTVGKSSVSQYPQLTAQVGEELTKFEGEVTRRSVRLSADGAGLSAVYTRHVGGQPIISNLHYDSLSELSTDYPDWQKPAEEYMGSISRTVTRGSKTVGDFFLRLLKMITIPLIVSSLITGITGLGNAERLGRMFGKTLFYYVATSLMAITTGIVMVNLVRPGIGAILPGTGTGHTMGADKSLVDIFYGLLTSMFPTNPAASLANGDFLSIITFSVLFGIFILHAKPESRESLTRFFESFFDVMMSMTTFIIHLAPIGVFAFIIYATISQGLDVFSTLAWYMLTVFLALVFHGMVTMPLIIMLVARRSPLAYFQALSPALMTAFSTASSNGTLPLTMTCVEQNAKVSNKVSSFVLPLGATLNMDGTALYEAVAVLFIAQATPGIDLSISSQIIVAITALLASVGAAGIPHAGLVMMAIVLQAVGLPLEAQGVIIAVDRVLDMCRTTINVWSDSCGCAVIERLEFGPNSPPVEAE